MSGYIKLFRRIQDHPLWTLKPADPARAWIDLILLAAWEPHKISIRGTTYTLNRGEMAASIRFLGNRWGWGHSKTASFLHRLHVDNQLEKIQDGSGDGSPTIYRIVNYETYQGDTVTEQDAEQDGIRTLAGRYQDETKKGKEGKRNTPPVFWSNFLLKFSDEEQRILSDALKAIGSTRKSGRIAESVQNGISGRLSSYPQAAVLAGCRTYLEKNCAAEGKDEKYLLGIVRRLSKNGFSHSQEPQIKTPGQLAIEAAMRERLAEVPR